MLADADPGCREASRSTLVALFVTASPAAKADLKKELERKNLRKALVDSILREVLGSDAAEHVLATEASELLPENTPAASSSRPMVPASHTVTASSEENISPVYIASRSDLDRTFVAMQPAFEGKESEHNWLNRETSIIKLRGILKAGAAEQFGSTFVNGIKTLADGILKAVASLRTTLAMQGISLISDLANRLGDDLEPCIDVFVPALLKMSGFTKKLVAAASQAAVKDIFVNVSYRHKFLDLIWAFMADKMITTRQAMSDHLYTLLVTHADHRRHALESHDGLATIEKFLKKGLGDQNKDVRARCRDSFIVYQRHWPARASTLIETLDATTKKQLAAALQEAASVVHETSSSATASSSSAASAPSGSSGPTGRKVSAPVGRPGGPSNAILAAKRAAAARMAQQKAEQQQRLEQEQEDDDAGVSAEQVSEAGPSYSTTPAAAPTAGKFRPDRNRSRTGPSTFATPGRSTAMPLDQEGTLSASRSTSGWARQASMTEEPHQHSRNGSNGISTPRRGVASSPGYDNAGPSSSATRHLTRGESASSPGSIVSRADRSPSAPNSFASRSPSKGFSAMESLRASRASNVAPRDPDDTVQLGQGVGDDSLGDATVDLMQGSGSPLKRSGYAMDDTLTLGADQTQDEDETMLLRDDDSRTMEDESGASTPRVRPPLRTASSRSSDATESTAFKTGGNAISALQAMSLRQSEQYPKTPSGNSSADSSASKYGSGWLLDRASRLEAENMSPLKSKPDALQWVEEIQKGTADVKVFKHLNRLSAAFRVEAPSSTTNGQRATQLEAGRGSSSSSQAGRQKMLEEDEEGDVDLTSPKLAQQTEAWREGRLFERLYQALSTFLLQEAPSSTTRSTLEQAAITTLHSLLRNQYPLFLAHSLESNFLELILTLRRIKEGKWNGIDRTCLELLSTWSTMTVPALGWRSLLRIMDTSHDDSTTTSTNLQARLEILTLSTLSLLLSRLPIQVLQEESEGLKSFPFIWKAFTNRGFPMMRQVGTNCLVGVYTRLRKDSTTEEEGVESCFEWIAKGIEGLKKTEEGESVVGPLDAKTKDLLLYFFAQAEREK